MEAFLNARQIATYFDRIGFRAEASIDRKTLDALTYAHQCSIPFETVDMYRCATPPSLDLDTVFKKTVYDRRGGYCFELNLLFETLLRSIGFEASPCLSRAVRGRDGRMPINHRGILVKLEGKTLVVDVGFGGPIPPGSLELEDGLVQVVQGETFITQKIDGTWWAVCRQSQGSKDLYGDHYASRIQTELELCTAPVEDIDFVALNLACSQPGSLFHDVRLANLRTAKGYIGLRDFELTIRENGATRKIPLPDQATFNEAVEQYFGFAPAGERHAEANIVNHCISNQEALFPVLR